MYSLFMNEHVKKIKIRSAVLAPSKHNFLSQYYKQISYCHTKTVHQKKIKQMINRLFLENFDFETYVKFSRETLSARQRTAYATVVTRLSRNHHFTCNACADRCRGSETGRPVVIGVRVKQTIHVLPYLLGG